MQLMELLSVFKTKVSLSSTLFFGCRHCSVEGIVKGCIDFQIINKQLDKYNINDEPIWNKSILLGDLDLLINCHTTTTSAA